MLDDGVPYRAILAELNNRRSQWPPGIDAINKMNLTNWRKAATGTGAASANCASNRKSIVSAIAYLKENHGNDLSRALPELVNYQLLQVMSYTETSDSADAIKDPISFSRVLNSLVRLRKAGKAL